MHVLSTRPSDKLPLADSVPTAEVVAIQSGNVRLGISGSEDTRAIRELPEGEAPTLPMLRRLMDKRIEIAREGINQAQQMLRCGYEEDARVLLEKVDEDLHLLRRRVRHELDKVETLTCLV